MSKSTNQASYSIITLILLPKAHQNISVVVIFKSRPKNTKHTTFIVNIASQIYDVIKWHFHGHMRHAWCTPTKIYFPMMSWHVWHHTNVISMFTSPKTLVLICLHSHCTIYTLRCIPHSVLSTMYQKEYGNIQLFNKEQNNNAFLQVVDNCSSVMSCISCNCFCSSDRGQNQILPFWTILWNLKEG